MTKQKVVPKKKVVLVRPPALKKKATLVKPPPLKKPSSHKKAAAKKASVLKNWKAVLAN